MRFAIIVVLLLVPFEVHAQELDLTGADFAGADLSDMDFTGAVIVGANFRSTGITPQQLASTASYQNRDLRGTIFFGTWNLRGADFSEQNLTDSDFRIARLDNADFSGANLTNASFLGARLANANFSGADLSHARVGGNFQGSESDLTNTNFASATLVGATIGVSTGADFTNAVLRDTILSSGITLAQLESTMSYQNRDLSGVTVPASVDLTGQDFSGWVLAGAQLPSLEGARLNGADLSNAWLENVREADLSAANIKGAQFRPNSDLTQEQFKSTASYQANDLAGVRLLLEISGWELSGANLTEAHITNGEVSDTNFSNATLTNASLWSSNFTDVSFRGADLAGALLRRSTLTNVDMSGANLTDVDFESATLRSVNLDGTDLRTVNLSGVRTFSGSLRGANLSGLALPSLEVDTDVTDAIVSETAFQAITESQLRSTQSYKNQNLQGVNFSRTLLDGWDLSGQDMRNAVFPELDGVNLSNTNLADSFFFWGDIQGADITGANIVGATFAEVSNLSEAQLQSTASYQARDLRGISLEVDVRGWDFSGQNLTDATLDSEVTDADFTGAIVNGIRFASNTSLNEEQLQSTASFQAKDLSRARLLGLDLSGSDLSGFDLRDTWLRQVNLSGTNLADAKLTGVNFTGANLRDLDLSGFDLQGADFGSADLSGAILTDANAVDTSFNGASTGGVSFLRTNLSGAKRLSFAASADLTDAVIDDAQIDGITEAQLQSTANYKDRNLRGIDLVGVDLTDWNLSEQDLRGAALGTTDLTGLDLRGATLSHAVVITSEFESIIVDSSTTYDQWTVFRTRIDTLEEFDPSDFGMTFRQTQAGDFDASGDLDADDIESLRETIREALESFPNNGSVDTASPLERFDLDEDGFLTEEDTSLWLEVTGFTAGDTNLDGMVNFVDFLTLSDGFGGIGSWSDGDFDGDGMLAFGDFLLLADNFGNTANAANASTISTVPEASGSLLAHLALVVLFAVTRGKLGHRPHYGP